MSEIVEVEEDDTLSLVPDFMWPVVGRKILTVAKEIEVDNPRVAYFCKL
jgi:hypothetical protein